MGKALHVGMVSLYTTFGYMLGLTVLAACIEKEAAGRVNDPYSGMRLEMVDRQIVHRGIRDARILDAMKSVPRHLFVPKHLRSEAYSDTPLPIGFGQTISQPYIVALMTTLLEPKPTDTVLEIGTGSGYQAAVLSRLVSHVYTIEIIPELGKQARKVLSELGYRNVSVRIGDGYKGWPEHAPYNAIIVTCAPDHVPKALAAQLADRGKIVIPVGDRFSQYLYVLEKRKTALIQTSILPVMFVPMVKEKP